MVHAATLQQLLVIATKDKQKSISTLNGGQYLLHVHILNGYYQVSFFAHKERVRGDKERGNVK